MSHCRKVVGARRDELEHEPARPEHEPVKLSTVHDLLEIPETRENRDQYGVREEQKAEKEHGLIKAPAAQARKTHERQIYNRDSRDLPDKNRGGAKDRIHPKRELGLQGRLAEGKVEGNPFGRRHSRFILPGW